GGQSLIPVLKLRLANPRVLVDINDLPGLAFIEERGGQLRIGALSRHRDFEQSKLIRGKYPIFSDVASVLGDPQVRNMGTIGGGRSWPLKRSSSREDPRALGRFPSTGSSRIPSRPRCDPRSS